jgi:ABC-type ATPase involved in cell division
MFAIAQKVYATHISLRFGRLSVDYRRMIYLGVNSGKEYVPFLMFLRRDKPTAGEGLIQQFNAGHAQNSKLTPVRQTTAAAFTCGLIGKKIHDSFLNAIVMRLHNSIITVIGKTQQASLMNRRQDQLMD